MSRRNPMPFKSCVHCRRGGADRPRGLCSTCYYRPSVRSLYPAMTAHQAGLIGGLTPKRRTLPRGAA